MVSSGGQAAYAEILRIIQVSVKTGAGGAFCSGPGCGVGDNNWMAIKELQAINNRCSDAVQVTDSDKADYRLMASFGGLIHNSAMLFDKDGKLVHEFKTGGRMSKTVCQYFEDKKKESR